jgi:phosphate uptake regulator
MIRFAGRQLHDALTAFDDRDLVCARELEAQDDAIDKLNRRIFRATLELDATTAQRELAMRHVLISRSVERIGDNAVDIGEQAAFLKILRQALLRLGGRGSGSDTAPLIGESCRTHQTSPTNHGSNDGPWRCTSRSCQSRRMRG